jgi:hypothetical protein
LLHLIDDTAEKEFAVGSKKKKIFLFSTTNKGPKGEREKGTA